jgi:NADPH:quinone reductase-like Zn-dependent oxidoreductase
VPADLSRISVTAKLAAYYRQFSDIAFAREAAKHIGADDAFEQLVRDHGLERDKLTFYAPMFEARYKSISQLLAASGCSQFLELASAQDLRWQHGIPAVRGRGRPHGLPRSRRLRRAGPQSDRRGSRAVVALRARPAAHVARAHAAALARVDHDAGVDFVSPPVHSSTMREQSDPLPTSNSRAVRLDSFGGPEVLSLREVPAPQAGPGQLRVRVTAAGLNPMDWFMTADADRAVRFGLSLPAGFGTDFAGVVDQVGDGATGFALGDRVFGGALSRAVADFVVVAANGDVAANEAHHTPAGVDDRTAATLTIAGRTAYAVLTVVEPGPDDTVLIGGAAGGVGVFAVQLARLAGARVIGTGSATSADFLRELGAEPVAYGEGLVDRVRALAPRGITAAIDLHETETALAARELGVADVRITTIASQIDGIPTANGALAAPGSLEKLASLVATGRLRVPIAATFPVEQIRAAVELQAGRHAKGKVVVDL